MSGHVLSRERFSSAALPRKLPQPPNTAVLRRRTPRNACQADPGHWQTGPAPRTVGQARRNTPRGPGNPDYGYVAKYGRFRRLGGVHNWHYRKSVGTYFNQDVKGNHRPIMPNYVNLHGDPTGSRAILIPGMSAEKPYRRTGYSFFSTDPSLSAGQAASAAVGRGPGSTPGLVAD